MLIRKAFRFRIYPNKTQQTELAKHFGAARFVYNHYLAARRDYYQETGTGLTFADCSADLADILKKDYPWLCNTDAQVLQQVVKDLDRAYVHFFKGYADYPKFRNKHHKQSIRYPQRFKFQGKRIHLPKVGWVKGVFHRAIEGTPTSCTVSKTKSGNYFVSIQCKMENDLPTPNAKEVGIDLGLTTFATLSNGDKEIKPKHLYRAERRLQIRQRRLSRKVKGSKGFQKARLPVVKLYERVANQRKDYQHKLSRKLVNAYGTLAFESLSVAGMVKNHSLAKAIQDAAWSQFVGFCEYKAAWANGQVLRVDRFFASSHLCSDCGAKHKRLTLNVRQWVCLNCGSVHDRDENASRNILKEATAGAAESHAGGKMSASVRASAPEVRGFGLE